MKFGMALNYVGDFRQTVNNLLDFESVGMHRVAVAEAYSYDAVSQLGYIAAKSSTLILSSGILPLYSRTPTNVAMTAAGLDYVSDGRFVLGIGASGPQVIEGFHGVKYDAPLGRTRETVEICRMVWRREALNFRGKYYQLPMTVDDGGSGLGKSLKLINHPVRKSIPLSLAAIGPKNVELAAELFDEWMPTLYVPDQAEAVFGHSLSQGAAKRSSDLNRLDILVNSLAVISDDTEVLEHARQLVRHYVALYVGGMGARDKNFYNQLIVRYGWADEAKAIQDLYLGGDKQAAAAAVPADLVDKISLIGSKGYVAERLEVFAKAGVTTIAVQLIDPDHRSQVETMRMLCEMAP